MYIEISPRASGKTTRLINEVFNHAELFTNDKILVATPYHEVSLSIKSKLETMVSPRTFDHIDLSNVHFMSNMSVVGRTYKYIFIDEFDLVNPLVLTSIMLSLEPNGFLYATSTLSSGEGLRALGLDINDNCIHIVGASDFMETDNENIMPNWLSPEHDNVIHRNVMRDLWVNSSVFKKGLMKFYLKKHKI
jgi:hypothetical protein